jgi:hypothetical protein
LLSEPRRAMASHWPFIVFEFVFSFVIEVPIQATLLRKIFDFLIFKISRSEECNDNEEAD